MNDQTRIERIRASQAGVVQPDETVLFLLGEVDRLLGANERLRAENDRLRAALTLLADWGSWDYADCGEHIPYGPCWQGRGDHPAQIAIDALALAGRLDAMSEGDEHDARPDRE